MPAACTFDTLYVIIEIVLVGPHGHCGTQRPLEATGKKMASGESPGDVPGVDVDNETERYHQKFMTSEFFQAYVRYINLYCKRCIQLGLCASGIFCFIVN